MQQDRLIGLYCPLKTFISFYENEITQSINLIFMKYDEILAGLFHDFANKGLKIDKNSIYFITVVESALIFKIKGTAESLFNIWIAHAKQRYPDYLFQARHEVLAHDLVVAFAKGLELIWRNENQKKHSLPGWAVGVVLDTVSSSLQTHWSQEYIFKQTPEYKELCYLKAITQYLKVDATVLKKTEALYNHLMSKEINVLEQDCSKDENIVDLNQFKKNKHPDTVFKNNIVGYLESIFYEKHFLIFGDILKKKCTFNLVDCFNTDEINRLIESVNRALPG